MNAAMDLRNDRGMLTASSRAPKVVKSVSLGSINNEEPVIVDQEDIIALTQDVKSFSDALASLKTVFTANLEVGDDTRVIAHQRLGEVLCILKNVLQCYPALHSTDLFSAAGALIGKIKNHNYEEAADDNLLQSFCDAIDQLALSFSSSVSEYLMGGMEPEMSGNNKTKSYDNLAALDTDGSETSSIDGKCAQICGSDIDVALVRLEAGLDLALQRAKAWSKYARDIMTYIEKKTQLELEYSKNLSRLAQSTRPVLTEEGFLPLQSVYCTLLAQDTEFSNNCQATHVLLQTSKFIEPLSTRRAEHDKVRKSVKEVWVREIKKMHDTVTNLRKAQNMYVSRQLEFDKARELTQKADADKHDKRKKLEEEAMHKAAEAETTYKACVAEANHRQQELEKVKFDLLGKIREQIEMCDQTMKQLTVDYFQLLHTVSAPLPVQFHTLCESSKTYEPGSQYAEFVRRLPIPAASTTRQEAFSFEAYVPGVKYGESRKPSTHSNGLVSSDLLPSNEGSPTSSPRKADKNRAPVKAWGQSGVPNSDSDSANGSSSNKSHDSSPSNSPHTMSRPHLVTSHSLDELVEEDSKNSNGHEQRRNLIKRMLTVAAEDSLMPYNRGRRNTTFGVDFQEQVAQFKREVPPIISKCLSEVEKRGMDIKGIYRVSGVKSKVENLCQRFDMEPEIVDLEEQHPNVISNVLKLYLRQLPEPLLTFRLYGDFINVSKESMAGAISSAKTVERLASLVRNLPHSNFKTLAVLVHHLQRVAAHSDVNQMSPSNLGIVFGPTLLRPAEGTASLASLVDTPHQTRAIELLISSAQTIFGPDADYQLVAGETPVELLPDENTQPTQKQKPSGEKVSAVSTEESSKPVSTAASIPPDHIVQPAEGETLSGLDKKSDFTLPGSTSAESKDAASSSSHVGCHTDGEESSDDLDLQSDDDLPDTLLPDDSLSPRSANPAVVTPHFMAGGVRHAVVGSSLSQPTSSQASGSGPVLICSSLSDIAQPCAFVGIITAADSSTSPSSASSTSSLLTAMVPVSPIKVVISEVGDSDDAQTEEIQVRHPRLAKATVVAPSTIAAAETKSLPPSTSLVSSGEKAAASEKRTVKTPAKTAAASGGDKARGMRPTSLPDSPKKSKEASRSDVKKSHSSTASLMQRKKASTTVAVVTLPSSSGSTRACCIGRQSTPTYIMSKRSSVPAGASGSSRPLSSSSLGSRSASSRKSVELSTTASAYSKQVTSVQSARMTSTKHRRTSEDTQLTSTKTTSKHVDRQNSGKGSLKRIHEKSQVEKTISNPSSLCGSGAEAQSSVGKPSQQISQDRTPRFV
ncbi:rho GTPase-activating protein 45-like isoform X2 [Gigantopelta aegis]|nr:rho GTPase-activating protein 45-like isoform X2 [Gigantopelta aegis]